MLLLLLLLLLLLAVEWLSLVHVGVKTLVDSLDLVLDLHLFLLFVLGIVDCIALLPLPTRSRSLVDVSLH